jgi:hypothetical protein
VTLRHLFSQKLTEVSEMAYCLHNQGDDLDDGVSTFETSVTKETARYNVTEGHHFHISTVCTDCHVVEFHSGTMSVSWRTCFVKENYRVVCEPVCNSKHNLIAFFTNFHGISLDLFYNPAASQSTKA